MFPQGPAMIAKAAFLLFFLCISFGVYAMSISDVGKVCLFSPMSGVVKLHGEPVRNARLVRTVSLSSRPKTDETFTDENGHFEFPGAYERTITKFLPMEFVAKQDIVVHYEGVEYEIWDGVKRAPEENVESRGKPLVVECELSMEELDCKSVSGGPIFSRCVWDVEGDPPYEGPFFDESAE
jgi:hypothetical protein